MIEMRSTDVWIHFHHQKVDIMIDYIKLDITHVGEAALRRKFSFHDVLKNKGRLLFHEAYYEGLTIQINSVTGRIFLSGSLHKFYRQYQTGESQNYDQFTFEQFMHCVELLKEHMGIDPETAKLIWLEVGVNIPVDVEPNLLIERGLVSYKNRLYSQNADGFRTSGSMKRFIFRDYEIKAYDKGQQYGLEGNILRWELKSLNSRFIRRTLHCSVLWHLCNRTTWERLGQELIDRWQKNVLAIDWDWVNASIEPRIRSDLLRYSNPSYWTEPENQGRSETRKRSRNLAYIDANVVPLFRWKDHVLSQLKSTIPRLYEQDIGSSEADQHGEAA